MSVSSPVDRLLCSKHYQQVYRMLNVVSKACVCCGVKRRHEHSATLSVNFVTCPDPKQVESYLRSAVGFSDTIQDGDQVCYLCYIYTYVRNILFFCYITCCKQLHVHVHCVLLQFNTGQ